MKHAKLISIILLFGMLQACGTLSTETTTLPFDIASTSGDVASTSSGTTGGDTSSAAAITFLERDMAWIKRDAASGQGEHVEALAALMGEPDPKAFAAWLQQHYAEVFTDTGAAGVYARIRTLRSVG